MEFTERDGARLAWRASGEGEPLLLIMGYGYSSAMWQHVEPGFSERFRVVAFDNRGIGESVPSPLPESMATLADDALAVLDAAGLDSAHVFGASMGGYVAQELALRAPDRVRTLILGCTSSGVAHAVPADLEVLGAFEARKTMEPERAVRALVPFVYHPGTPGWRIAADLEARLRDFPSKAILEAQLDCVARWSSRDRLGAIRCPTLVIHGEQDRLIPVENGRLLAAAIEGARFVPLPGASHLFFTDRPETTVDLIADFLGA